MKASVFAQNTEEAWDTYTAAYDDGKPGSVTLRMDLIDIAPMENLPGLVITGLTYKTKREDGFPEPETLDKLYQLTDELITIMEQEYQGLLVGSFMHNNERLEYFYVNNTEGLKARLKQFYQENYVGDQFYIAIKDDRDWEYYMDLYPKPETQHYMEDQSMVRLLVEAGDDLQYPRRVDHWIDFPTRKEMKAFLSSVENRHFNEASHSKNKALELPYELQIWRVDKVDIAEIHSVTSELRKLATKYGGKYDGWEAAVVK